MAQVKVLKRIAIGIGICGVAGITIANNTVPYIYNMKLQDSVQYKEAVQLLQNHPEAVKYLGEPIIKKRVKVTQKEHFGCDEDKMYVKVPVIGSKSKGFLYYDYLVKDNDKQSGQLLNVELTVANREGYKLIIKKPS